MRLSERPIAFDCEGDDLVGLVTVPETARSIACLVIVGGPQYRVGSHRQFVQLTRALAAAGIASLRFDSRGMGDSEGEPHSFEQLDDDIAAALQALRREVPEAERVVLIGLCDGASAALMYLDRRGLDRRVAGLCLMNPWVRTEAGEAAVRVRHYYLDRLKSGEFWSKLLRGGVAQDALTEAANSVWRMVRRRASEPAAPTRAQPDAAHFTDRMARGAQSFDGPLMLVTSGRDYTAKEFLNAAQADRRWREVLQRPATRRIELPDADHTFSAPADERQFERYCVAWLDALCAEAGGMRAVA